MGGSWFVYNFECPNEPMVSRLCEWFEENHPVEFPIDEYHVFGELGVGDKETRGADYAWVGNYLYVTCRAQRRSLLRETAEFWDRAVAAHVDATTETVTEAALVGKDEDGSPETTTAYQGKDGWAGNGLEVVFARDHGFRFRAYSAASPTTQATPYPGAFDHFYGRFDAPEAVLAEIAAESSLGVDADTRAYLREDPATEPRYPDDEAPPKPKGRRDQSESNGRPDPERRSRSDGGTRTAAESGSATANFPAGSGTPKLWSRPGEDDDPEVDAEELQNWLQSLFRGGDPDDR